MEKKAHLILEHKWYDKIRSGEKTVEYRENTDYWRRRLRGVYAIVFHRGYTNTTMTFEVDWIKSTELEIQIKLGARID